MECRIGISVNEEGMRIFLECGEGSSSSCEEKASEKGHHQVKKDQHLFPDDVAGKLAKIPIFPSSFGDLQTFFRRITERSICEVGQLVTSYYTAGWLIAGSQRKKKKDANRVSNKTYQQVTHQGVPQEWKKKKQDDPPSQQKDADRVRNRTYQQAKTRRNHGYTEFKKRRNHEYTQNIRTTGQSDKDVGGINIGRRRKQLIRISSVEKIAPYVLEPTGAEYKGTAPGTTPADEDKKRRDCRTPRIAMIKRYSQSAFMYLYQLGNDQALLNCCGVNHVVFIKLLDIFEPLFSSYTIDKNTGSIWKFKEYNKHDYIRIQEFDATGCLALTLSWFQTRGSAARAVAIMFGLTASPVYRWLKIGRKLLVSALQDHPAAKVCLPNEEEMQQYINAIAAKYPALGPHRVRPIIVTRPNATPRKPYFDKIDPAFVMRKGNFLNSQFFVVKSFNPPQVATKTLPEDSKCIIFLLNPVR
eukprot:jgi/Psemu1/34130/gm1.34130_g